MMLVNECAVTQTDKPAPINDIGHLGRNLYVVPPGYLYGLAGHAVFSSTARALAG
jgi:hypothetical protein